LANSMNISDTISVPAAQKAATAVTYTASGAAIFFGFNANELGVFIGLFIAFGAGVTNAYIGYHFRQKHFKLVEAYVKSGAFDRRKTDRQDDICERCPMVKHRHDYDNT